LSCELESIRYDVMERDWEVELAEKHSEDMISQKESGGDELGDG